MDWQLDSILPWAGIYRSNRTSGSFPASIDPLQALRVA
jgi:hypothetical protein